MFACVSLSSKQCSLVGTYALKLSRDSFVQNFDGCLARRPVR